MLSSSIQATLVGRFGNLEYGRSKKTGEELFFEYAKDNDVKVAVYRFPNLMGHSRPNITLRYLHFLRQLQMMKNSR